MAFYNNHEIWLGSTMHNTAMHDVSLNNIIAPLNLPDWLPDASTLQTLIDGVFEQYDVAEKTNYLMFAYTTDSTQPKDDTLSYEVIIGWIKSGATAYRFTDANGRCFTARKHPFDSPYEASQINIRWELNQNTGEMEWRVFGKEDDERIYVMWSTIGQNNPHHLITLIEKGSAVTYTTDLPSYVNFTDLTEGDS